MKENARKGLFLTLLLCMVMARESVAQKEKVITPKDTAIRLSPDLREVSVDSFFLYIKKQAGFKPIYNSALISNGKLITYRQKEVPLHKMLDTVLGRLGLGYTFDRKEGFIRLHKDEQRMHQFNTADTLQGKVTDDKGEPLGGISVLNREKGIYVLTSHEGIFELPWPAGSLHIDCTHKSYEKKSVSVANPAAFQRITLKPSFGMMDEVVVMAYHNIAQRNNTASVYRVPGKELQRGSINPIKELSGRVPGLMITEASGAPGAAVRVQIRGRQSIGTIPGIDNQPLNDPLLLLNKIPLITGNRPVTVLPSITGNPQAGGTAAGGISAQGAINPKNIESVEVLKDADATAIYGSRGAHGAVLFTTRQGKIGKPFFNFDLEKGAVVSTLVPRLLNNRQYTAMRKEAMAAAGVQPTPANAPDLLLLDTNDYQNIPELLVGGTGHLININGSMSGGDTLLRYYGSTNFYRETSVMPAGLYQQRFAAYGNLQYRSPNRRLQSGLSLHYSNLYYKTIGADPMYSAELVPLLPRLRDDAGKLVWGKNGFSFVNPLGQFSNINHTRINVFTASLQVEYRLWKNVLFRTTLGYQWLPVKEDLTLPRAGRNPLENPKGEAFTGSNQFKGWIAEPQLAYSRTSDHMTVGGLLGATFQEERNAWNTFWGTGYESDAELGQPGAASNITVNQYAAVYRYHGVYGRYNMDWRDRYFLNATGRLDASSRFGSQRNMAFFGALGAAWIFSEELAIKRAIPFLTYGKLRGSYGTAGNDHIPDYGYLETWKRPNDLLPYDGTQALYPNRQANPRLGWEKNRKKEIALELEFWERVFFNAAWYHNITSGQLISIKTPGQAGPVGSMIINSPARVLNTGWELTVRSAWQWNRKYSFTSTFLVTLPRNRLIDFPGIENTAYHTTLVVGQPLSVQQGHPFLGVDPDSGLFIVPATTPKKDIIGHREPAGYASWLNECRLGQFRIAVFLEARKQQAVNPLYYVYAEILPGRWSPTQWTNQPVAVWQRWRQPGDNAPLQRWTVANTAAVKQATQYYWESEEAMTGASFLRLRSVYVSWELTASWVKRVRLSEARIYLQGRNLWTLTSYRGGDPSLQSPLTLPSLRTITAGIQVSF
jgi:TonB-linked SusC/RagA family outer membrane protein